MGSLHLGPFGSIIMVRKGGGAVGTVFSIQKFCTDDGPGIRTTVFLKGCHLHCRWCHNPEGPTSVMNAALSLEQGKCAGTCVLNLRLDSANFRSPERREKVLQLIRVYFARGGSQLQVNVVDPETLLDAYHHPEKHRNIIVRVGGFSDNFVLLDKAIQEEILKRTQYSI